MADEIPVLTMEQNVTNEIVNQMALSIKGGFTANDFLIRLSELNPIATRQGNEQLFVTVDGLSFFEAIFMFHGIITSLRESGQQLDVSYYVRASTGEWVQGYWHTIHSLDEAHKNEHFVRATITGKKEDVDRFEAFVNQWKSAKAVAIAIYGE